MTRPDAPAGYRALLAEERCAVVEYGPNPEREGDGDVLIHVRRGCLVHVAEGVATMLPREESVRLAGRVLSGGPTVRAGVAPPAPENVAAAERAIDDGLSALATRLGKEPT